MRKTLLSFMILLLANLAVSANEIFVVCKFNWGDTNFRIDFDNSVVTEVFGPRDTARYHAAISREYIEWKAWGWTRKLNRFTGNMVATPDSGTNPWHAHCEKAEQQL